MQAAVENVPNGQRVDPTEVMEIIRDRFNLMTAPAMSKNIQCPHVHDQAQFGLAISASLIGLIGLADNGRSNWACWYQQAHSCLFTDWIQQAQVALLNTTSPTGPTEYRKPNWPYWIPQAQVDLLLLLNSYPTKLLVSWLHFNRQKYLRSLILGTIYPISSINGSINVQ